MVQAWAGDEYGPGARIFRGKFWDSEALEVGFTEGQELQAYSPEAVLDQAPRV